MRQTPLLSLWRSVPSARRTFRSAMLLVLVLASERAPNAAEFYSLDSMPGGLPKTVVPLHYAIQLEPDLQQNSIAGSAAIDVEVREPTTRIVLNALDLTLRTARIEPSDQQPAITMDAVAEAAVLNFPQPLAAGPHKLHLTFAARINKFRAGLFAIDYGTDAGPQRMIATRLEPTGARRIFPCWDHPAFKATIALTLTVPRSYLAISNMPVTDEEAVTPFLKQVSFARTPPMPIYLFALFSGELDRLTADAEGAALSVLTVKGKREQGRFAIRNAAKLMRHFNGYFGLKYPLPKLDLIALPEGTHEAMESWGVIASSEARLLFDSGISAPSARRDIFAVLAHGMAQQWTGTLVTMPSWEDRWLNEGLAEWMQREAAEQLFPRWSAEIDQHAAKESAMQFDAQPSSRAMQQAVAERNGIMPPFHRITDAKSHALIRMLAGYVGADAFRTGIRAYIDTHAYGHATPADLWHALEAASPRQVSEIARAFTQQPSVPVVNVQTRCVGDKQIAVLRERRFSVGDPNTAPQSWVVPITVGRVQGRDSASVFLLKDEKEISFGSCGEPIKLNVGDTGYYRVEYDVASRSALTNSFAFLNSTDRVNVLDDTWAMVESERIPPSAYLAFLQELGPDEDGGVCEQIIRTFVRLDRLARGRPERAGLQTYLRARLRPVLDRLKWDPISREDMESTILRAEVIHALGEFNDQDVIGEAQRRFASFMGGASTLAPALRDAVTHVVGLHADRATYESLLALARTRRNAHEQLRYYSAAASARDPVLARETLDLILSENIPNWLKPRLLNSVASAGQHAELVWEFLQKNFAALAVAQGPYFRDYFVSDFMRNFSDVEHARALADFRPAHATEGASNAAQGAYEAIMIAAALKERLLPSVRASITGQTQSRR
jgi:aminopeptidase N